MALRAIIFCSAAPASPDPALREDLKLRDALLARCAPPPVLHTEFAKCSHGDLCRDCAMAELRAVAAACDYGDRLFVYVGSHGGGEGDSYGFSLTSALAMLVASRARSWQWPRTCESGGPQARCACTAKRFWRR